MNNEITTEALLDELISDEEIGAAANETDVSGTGTESAPETGAPQSAENAAPTADNAANTDTAENDPTFREWLEFFMEHRDLSSEGIPDTVYRMAAKGAGPETAYAIYQAQEQINELREALKKAEARAAAPGSLFPTAGNEPAADPFTEGWESV